MCRFVAGLFTIVVITTAAAQSCPANQIASDAQIIIYDQTVFSSADIRRFANSSDPNLTFFREILGYSEDVPFFRQAIGSSRSYMEGASFQPGNPKPMDCQFCIIMQEVSYQKLMNWLPQQKSFSQQLSVLLKHGFQTKLRILKSQLRAISCTGWITIGMVVELLSTLIHVSVPNC